MLKMIRFCTFLFLVSTALLSSSFASEFTISYDETNLKPCVFQPDGQKTVIEPGFGRTIHGLGTVWYFDTEGTISLAGESKDSPVLTIKNAENLTLSLCSIHLAELKVESLKTLSTLGEVTIDKASNLHVENLKLKDGEFSLKNAVWVVEKAFYIRQGSVFHAGENLKVSFAAIGIGDIIKAKYLNSQLFKFLDLGKLTVSGNLTLHLVNNLFNVIFFGWNRKFEYQGITIDLQLDNEVFNTGLAVLQVNASKDDD